MTYGEWKEKQFNKRMEEYIKDRNITYYDEFYTFYKDLLRKIEDGIFYWDDSVMEWIDEEEDL